MSTLAARRARFDAALQRSAAREDAAREAGEIIDDEDAWLWAESDVRTSRALVPEPWPTQWVEPMGRGAMRRARAALLALDVDGVRLWLDMVARAAARGDAVAHLAGWARTLADLLVGCGTAVEIAHHERVAARAQDAVAVVDLAAFAALAALRAGELAEALRIARRASRMARAEQLGAAERIAHVVLARVRRMNGQPQLAARICHSLVSREADAWTAWELAMTGSPSTGPLGHLLHALETRDENAYMDVRREISQNAPPPWIASDLAAALAALDLEAPVPEAMERWVDGRDDTLPPVLVGIALRPLAADDEDATVYVLATPLGARRFLRAGLARAQSGGAPRLAQGYRKQGRTESLVAALALAGRDGLDDAQLFSRVYGFAYDARIHRGSFDVALHRARAYVEGVGTLRRHEGRCVLDVDAAVIVPDPRHVATDERALLLVAGLGSPTAAEVAQGLNLSLRVAQRLLGDLTEAGSCTAERDGRAVRYFVEDTTYSEITAVEPARPEGST